MTCDKRFGGWGVVERMPVHNIIHLLSMLVHSRMLFTLSLSLSVSVSFSSLAHSTIDGDNSKLEMDGGGVGTFHKSFLFLSSHYNRFSSFSCCRT